MTEVPAVLGQLALSQPAPGVLSSQSGLQGERETERLKLLQNLGWFSILGHLVLLKNYKSKICLRAKRQHFFPGTDL